MAYGGRLSTERNYEELVLLAISKEGSGTRPGNRRPLANGVQDRLERGEPSDQAKSAALREFGNVSLVKEVVRNVSVWRPLESIGKDTRFVLRVLARSPGFSASAIFALAFGIGANTALYSIVHSVLLNPLPFRDPQRLVRLWDSFGSPGNYSPVSYPNFRDWRT